ncbi:hypothetical protein ACEPPN_000717 [Leptodophora sp. 'Broadleaf-Isolate-01']
MHPIVTPAVELLGSRRARRLQKAASSKSSALKTHHAQVLASYIKSLFLSGELLEDWPEYAERYSYDSFWIKNEPVFYAYDYGANIKIEVSEGVQSLDKEKRLRPVDDSEDISEDDLSDDEWSGERQGSRSQHSRTDSVVESASHQAHIQNEWQLGSSPGGLYSDGLKQLATVLD